MSLVTRQFGPNAKNSKLSFYDMDMNLYYLQELGVSGLSYSNNILTLTNPTGGTKSVNLNEVTAFTYNNLNTFLISDSEGNQFSAIIDEVSGLTVNGTLSATTYLNLPPASFTGGTVNGATSFINGLSANTISATTYQNLPQDVFVTGGTYTNGEILFRNNSGGTFTVTGLPIGGAGGQIYYFNLSESQSPYREFSPIGTNGVEQSTGVTINSGVTDVISSFITPTGYPNALTIPAGYWSFYLHAHKDSINASFDIFCEVYTVTTGGTETLILSTEGADVQSVTPTVSMQLTDGYYSGKTIDVSDRILVKVLATNTGQQTNTITFFTEGQSHYSYGITPFSNFNALTCETLSGCTTIFNLENNKVNKSGDTMTGTLNVPTISATTYQNLPDNVTGYYLPLSGGTVTGNTSYTNGLTADTISATTYQNLPVDPNTFVTGFTYNNNTFTINQNNNQPDLSTTINTVTGLTVNGNITVTGNTTIQGLSASTISATTYYNLPFDKDSSVIITPISSTNTINTLGTNGFLTISNPGTGSSTINGNNYYLSLGKITCRCSANFGAVASVYPSVTNAYAPRLDYGMMASFKFGIDAQATNMRMFVGLGGGTSAPTNVEPDTLTNHIGICKPSGSTNFHIMSNDNTGVATLIDLGANFPANTSQTDVYFLRLWGNNSSVNYLVERYSSTNGSVINSSFGVINSDIPISSTILLPRIFISNNTTNNQVSFMVNRITMSYLQ